MRKLFFATTLALSITGAALAAAWVAVDYNATVLVVNANGDPDKEMRHRVNAWFAGVLFLQCAGLILSSAKEL